MSDAHLNTCATHATPMVRLGTRWLCTTCLSEQTSGDRARIEAAKERAVSLGASHKARHAAGIPQRFVGLGFDSIGESTPRNDKVVAAMRSLCSNFEAQRHRLQGLFFIGPPGCGKTHLAAVMANELQQLGRTSAYRSLPSLMQEFHAVYRQAEMAAGLLDFLVSVDLLILDEIDLHGRSDHDYALVFDLINRRYERPGRLTLCISNRSIEHLQVDLDERITTRILGARRPILWDAFNHRATAKA